MTKTSKNGNGVDNVTPASEIRAMREQGVEQTLLSGITVRMRTVSPDSLLKSGRVPDILTPLVTKMIFEEVANERLDEFLAPREQAKEGLEVTDAINVVCEAALVNPRIVLDPVADDEINIYDLSIADRGWIFKLAFQPAEVLRRFRRESLGDVGLVPLGDDLSPAATQPVPDAQEEEEPASSLPV